MKLWSLREVKYQKLEARENRFLKELNFQNISLEEQVSTLSYLTDKSYFSDKKVHSLSLKNCSAFNDEILQKNYL